MFAHSEKRESSVHMLYSIFIPHQRRSTQAQQVQQLIRKGYSSNICIYKRGEKKTYSLVNFTLAE